MELFNMEDCKESDLKIPREEERSIRRFHCNKRDALVIKIIRLDRLRDIELIPNIKSANIKIIQLTRDPRAMFNSRFLFYTTFYTKLIPNRGDADQKRALSEYDECNLLLDDLSYVTKTPWIQEKYIRVTYNDIILEPKKWATIIYNFVNLNLPDEVLKWMEGKNSDENYFDGIENSLTTRKNASEMYQKWMTIRWYRVDNIKSTETQCSHILKKLNLNHIFDPEVLIKSYNLFRYKKRLHPNVNITFL